MNFGEYLKLCREHCDLTQEKLVVDLYNYDIDNFEHLDNSMLSKWERNFAEPKVSRKISIIKYFQEQTGTALPWWDEYSVEKIEKMLCKTGMNCLLGKCKDLVLNFPSPALDSDNLHIYQIRNSKMFEQVLQINMDLDRHFNHDIPHLQSAQLKEWAIHPANSFFICEYHDEFFGLFFSLKLKPEVFEKIMKLEIFESELTTDDFASLHERGCNHMISFFAMNEKIASALFIKYYAYLIRNQKMITKVGFATMMGDAKKLMENMNFYHYANKMIGKNMELQTYQETLPNFLASKNVVKMILFEDKCRKK